MPRNICHDRCIGSRSKSEFNKCRDECHREMAKKYPALNVYTRTAMGPTARGRRRARARPRTHRRRRAHTHRRRRKGGSRTRRR